jgi:hypothetical protein
VLQTTEARFKTLAQGEIAIPSNKVGTDAHGQVAANSLSHRLLSNYQVSIMRKPMDSLKIFSCSMLVILLASSGSMAEDKSAQNATDYMPRLGNLMAAIQLRHAKLFYAVKRGNWHRQRLILGPLVTSSLVWSEAGFSARSLHCCCHRS